MDTPSDIEINDFLEFLIKEKSKRTLDSYYAIKKAIYMYTIPFPTLTLSKGLPLYRSRVHQVGENFFHSIDDLSHVVDKSKIKCFGRANEPLQSIFYCSDNSDVAFFETSKIVRENYEFPNEMITTGIWEVQEDIRVAMIPANSTIYGLNTTVDGLQTEFEDLVLKFKNQNSDLHLKVLDLLSNEYTRDAHGDNSNYYISCAFSNYIYETTGYDTELGKIAQVGGILYSSVIHREEGMNLALKPELIETNKILLKKAVRKFMIRTNPKEYIDSEVIESVNIDQSKNEIIWK